MMGKDKPQNVPGLTDCLWLLSLIAVTSEKSQVYMESKPKGRPMTPPKTLQQRERELQTMLANHAGREKLLELESKYHAASGRVKPAKTSVITYILVYEREQGLING
jgi:hypothetical protein